MTILFDLDGTLIDSTEAILESFAEAFKAFDKLVPQDELIVRQIGLPLSIMFDNLGTPKEQNEDYVLAYKAHYRQISCAKTYLLPFAKEAVELANKFATLGVVTTKTARYSKEILEHLDILKYFETVVGFEDVQNPKPHPEPIFLALDRMGKLVSKNCYMIGDTNLDINAANSAGISHIAVHSGYESKEDLQKISDFVKKDAKEAVEFIMTQKINLNKT